MARGSSLAAVVERQEAQPWGGLAGTAGGTQDFRRSCITSDQLFLQRVIRSKEGV